MQKRILQILRDEEDYAYLPTFLTSVKRASAVNLPDNHLVCFFVRFSYFLFVYVYKNDKN